MGHREDYEFFDPRRLRPADESPEGESSDPEERITGAAPQPDLTAGSLRPNHPFKPAPEVSLPQKEFRGSDLYYHRLTPAKTPMPEAWLAFLGGLAMLAGSWLPWTDALLAGQARGAAALELGQAGRFLLAGAALTALAGLLGVVLRRGRLALVGWLTGLGPLVAAAWLAPRLYQGEHLARVDGLLVPTRGLGLGLVVFGLGALLAVLGALWASSPRVGR